MRQGKIHPKVKEVVVRLSGFFPSKEIARYLGISSGSVRKVLRTFKELGKAHIDRAPAQRQVLGAAEGIYINRLVRDRPDYYLEDIRDRVFEVYGVDVSLATICRAIKRGGNTRKKLSKVAIERDEDRRAMFRWHMFHHYTADQLVHVDESRADARMTFRSYGWAPKGQRAAIKSNFVRGNCYSILPAISLTGVLDIHVVQGAVNGEAFFHFIRGLLDEMNPFPGPNSVLVLDNAAIHKNQELRDMITQRGMRIVYLPPYSPDFNPIEEGFSAMKAWIRRHGKEVRKALDGDLQHAKTALIMAVMQSMTADSIYSWYHHSGYF